MKNRDLYISPYGTEKKKGTSPFTYFLLSLLIGGYITAFVLLCIKASL
jgi:hypothetical protein